MATSSELQKLYLAYFGRPADPGGIVFYANTPVATVLQGFSASPESRALYGAGFSTASVKAIYTYLFNRPAADSEAAFWVGVVNAPNSAVSPAAAALTILQSAHNDDLAGISNKLAVAANFTASLDTAAKLNGYSGDVAAQAARSFLSTVDASSGSVATAFGLITAQKTGVPGLASPPASLVLTTGIDTLTGTAGDDIFTGGFVTYGATDSINGGDGFDTLSLSPGGSLTLANNLRSIERLSITASGYLTVTGQSASGLAEVVNSGSSSPGSVKFLNFTGNLNLGVFNTSGETYLGVLASALSGNADAVTVTLSGAGSATQAAVVALQPVTASTNEYEILNLVSTGAATNRIRLYTDSTQTSLKTLKISGSAPLVLTTFDNTISIATTIDASAATGGVSLGSRGLGNSVRLANHTITLGSGNDAVYLDAGLDGNDTLDGGAGTDTLGSSVALTAANMAHVRNFEVADFDATFGAIVQDAGIAALAGVNYVISGQGLTLNNAASGTSTTVLSNVNTLSESLKTPGGTADSLTVVIGAADYTLFSSLATLSDIAGLETLRLVSAGPQANVIGNDLVTAAHVVTGSTELRINNMLLATSFDASGFSGKLEVTLGRAPTTFKGGSGTTLVGVNASFTALADTIALGSGASTVEFLSCDTHGNGGATGYGGFAHITGFKPSDTLAFSYNAGPYALGDGSGQSTGPGLYWGMQPAGNGQAVLQTVAQNAPTVAAAGSMAYLKLSTGVAAGGTVAATFAQAMGSASVTGLGHSNNYVAMAYDTTHSQALVAIVNTGGSGHFDNVLSAADFTAASVSVVGVIDMSAATYASLGAANLLFSF